MFKKIMFIAIFSTISSVASAEFVTDSTIPGFKPSKAVSVGYEASDLGGSSGNVVYAISSKHQSGSQVYGSSSATTKMYSVACDAGTVLDSCGTNIPGVPGSATDAETFSGWNVM